MSDVKIKTFTGSGSINFEEDQREDLNSVNDAKSLSDQVVKLKQLEDELVEKEEELKELKRHIELVSGQAQTLDPWQGQHIAVPCCLRYDQRKL